MADTTFDGVLEAADAHVSDVDPSTQGGFRVVAAREVRPRARHGCRGGNPAATGPPVRDNGAAGAFTHRQLSATRCPRPRGPLALQVPLEIRLQTTDQAPQEVGTLEAVVVKVLVKGDGGDGGAPTAVRVELSNEADLFFHYASVVDAATFRAMRDEQHLMVEFADFVGVLTRSIDNAIREPSAFLAVLVTNREGAARLDFIQNVSFKFVELLSLPFARSPDDVVRAHIAHRYARVKAQLAVARGRLHEVVSIVRLKNPSLLLALTTPARAGGSGGGGSGAAPAGGGGGGAGGSAATRALGATTSSTGGGFTYGARA